MQGGGEGERLQIVSESSNLIVNVIRKSRNQIPTPDSVLKKLVAKRTHRRGTNS